MTQISVLTGPPLSGKSTLAALYAAESGVPVIEMDSIRLRVLPDSDQSRADRDIAYRCMHYTAERMLLAGVGRVVLVATYSRTAVRREIAAIAERCGADVHIIRCKVSPDQAVKRFLARSPGHAAIDLTEASVHRQAATYQECAAAITIDTSDLGPLESVHALIKAIHGYGSKGLSSVELSTWADGDAHSAP